MNNTDELIVAKAIDMIENAIKELEGVSINNFIDVIQELNIILGDIEYEIRNIEQFKK